MKSFRIYIGLALLLMVIYVIAQVNKPKPVNWQTTLYYNDKIPFGTYILYNEMRQLFPGTTVERLNLSPLKAFKDTTLSPGNYFIIAKTITLDKSDFKAMTRFISQGNSVFMSANSFYGYLADTLKLNTEYMGMKKGVEVNFTSPALRKPGNYQLNNTLINQYFDGFDTTRAVSLSRTDEGQTNYLRFNYGKGSLYVFANPYVLTNYGLLDKTGAEYAARVLSYLPQAQHLYWDQYQNHDIPEDMSPMRVLLSYSSLRWAYYLSLAALLLFTVYEAKRRQRIIPVINPLRNTTLDFVSVVGRVYYEQRDNADIAAKKINYLFEYLRTNFQLKFDFGDREFIDRLANKTGIDRSFAIELMDQLHYTVRQSRLTDHELILLNNLIDKFYAQTK